MTIRSRRTSKVCHLAFLFLGGIISCTAGDSGPPLVVQRDSAGIQIVEAMRPLWGDSSDWSIRVDPVVDLTLSGSGPRHEFYRVRGMKQRPNGSLMVADGSSLEVRLYSETGVFQGSLGGSGGGPGEFRDLDRIEMAGDTLLALGDGRVTVVAPDLTAVRTFDLDRFIPGLIFTTHLHYLDEGAILPELFSPVLPGRGPGGLLWHPVPLLLFDMEGEQIDSIGETRGHEQYVSGEGSSRTGGPLFARTSHIAALGQRIYRGSSEMMQVEELDTSGNLVRILRVPDYPLELTEARIAAEREALIERFAPMGGQQLFENAPAAETRPAFADILVDPSGAVWLELYRGESEQNQPEEWLVLDADGTWLGAVEIPDRFNVVDITMDAVLGVWEDELDIEHPQVLRLTRS